MATTIGTTCKYNYAILRTKLPTNVYLYRLVEVRAATREGKVKAFRPYGNMGAATTNLRALGEDAVFFALALGRPWSATGTYTTMIDICEALHLVWSGGERSLVELDAAIR